MGLLANQIWSYAGKSSRGDVSLMTLQPFLSHTLPDTTAFTLNSETTYDWEARHWTVPINLMVGHIFKAGEQRFVGARGQTGVVVQRSDGFHAIDGNQAMAVFDELVVADEPVAYAQDEQQYSHR